MNKDNDKKPGAVPATTPPIAPTEPTPIPVDMDNVDADNFKESVKDNDTDVSAPKYYCPMHCEGDKVYDQPGNCPICGMKLVSVDTP